MKNKFLIFFLLLLFGRMQGQYLAKSYYLVDSLIIDKITTDDRKVLDAMMEQYHQAKSDTARQQVIWNIIENVVDENIWIKYNRLLYNEARKKQEHATGRELYLFKSNEAQALNNFGYYYFNYSDLHNLATHYYMEGLKMYESISNHKELVVAYSNIANVYQVKGEMMKSLEWYKKSLALEEKVTSVADKSVFVAPMNNVAQLYIYFSDTLNCISTLKKSLGIMKKDDKNMKAHLLHNLGVISYHTGDRMALQSIKNALALRREINDRNGIVQSALMLANLNLNTGNFHLAEEYLGESRGVLDQLNNPALEGLYYKVLSGYLDKQGKKQAAIDCIEKSIKFYTQQGGGFDLNDALAYLITLCGKDVKYARKKLQAYEMMEDISSKLNRNRLQKVMMKEMYEEQLQAQEAVFKAEEKLTQEKNRSEKKKQQYILTGITMVLLLTLVFSFFIFKAFTHIRKNNVIISEQKQEVEKQKSLVEEKHKDITDSINYAQRIQSALIISESNLKKNFKEAFVIFQPRDIVSGDFYWFSEHQDTKIVALADCTGHGVPGAFMSMIGITLLNSIVKEKGITSPALILQHLRKELINTLSIDAPDKKDGMDMAIIAVKGNQLKYAGANSRAILFDKGNLLDMKPNKQPIGVYERQEDFTEQQVEITPGLKVYLFSDGMVDQFGGKDGKKIKTKQLKEWILQSSSLPLTEQKRRIEENLLEWKTGYNQTDDISLIGLIV